MSEDAWYYVDSGQRIGPLGLLSLKKILVTLPDSETLLVWCEGFPDWKLAGDVKELRAVMPPPVPETHRAASMPEWEVRWWWYLVALFFVGSIGSRDGRKAMAWVSSERARRRKVGRMPLRGEAEIPDQQRTGLQKIFTRKFRNSAIFGASALYSLYLGLEKPPVLVWLAAGAIVGTILVGMAEAVAWLLRLFREKLPRAAFYVGTTLFWLGIAVAVWCAGLSGYVLYEDGPIRLVGMFAGLSAFYGLIGWGIRHALVR